MNQSCHTTWYAQAYGQLETQLDMSLDDIDPTENWTLIVRASSTKELARTFRIDGQLEGRVLPAIRHAGGLHIEVAVDEQRFLEKARRSAQTQVMWLRDIPS